MTLLTPDDRNGPRTHAIVIGIGNYPEKLAASWGLKSITSPVPSAKAFAKWFLEEFNNPKAPRGTLEVCLSNAGAQESWTHADGSMVDIEPARKANVVEAVDRWAARAHDHVDNITLFFFCGHGISSGIHSGLCLEDFGSNAGAPLRNVIDIDRLHAGMDTRRARQQCYFIDACRNTPNELGRWVKDGGIGDKILDALEEQGYYGPRDAPMFQAALPGQNAYGRRNKESLFTEALLETLRRGASVKEGGTWVINTERVLMSLNAHLRRIKVRARKEQLPLGRATVNHGSAFVLHSLNRPPKVPVVVRCTPESATAAATLSFDNGAGVSGKRLPRAPEEWYLDCDVDTYTFDASFDDPAYHRRSERETVAFPTHDVELKVVL